MNLRRLLVATFAKITVIFSLSFLLLVALHPGPAFAQSPGKTLRKVIERVEPEYPDFFRNGHFEGRIVAVATVLPNGTVSSVEIKAGNPMFATFAAKALKKWKYAPGPDKTMEDVIFNFRSGSH
jgi:outer membrane biosynthesis protein TonB